MKFDWDENKRQTNIRKHGIDFVDAVHVFYVNHITYEDDRPIYDERRFSTYGFWKTHLLIVTHTYADDDMIRIISARKANKYEQKRFFS